MKEVRCRSQKKKYERSQKAEVRSEVFILCAVVTVRLKVLLMYVISSSVTFLENNCHIN
jgi:hypothetical protein